MIFALLGVALESVASAPLVDFKGLYYPARCLAQHCDPYNEGAVLRVYQAEAGAGASQSAKVRQLATLYVYPPTTFLYTAGFALLSWKPAYLIGMALSIVSLVFASLLAWSIAADFAPILAGGLIGFLLANSEVLVITGNAAGLAISLCLIAVWCFVRQRFLWAGIFCLAISLAIKPHDAGLVWLYFLLAGGVYRRRALQTFLATIAISLPALLWVWRVSPHWMQELQANIASSFSLQSGINNPGLASSGAHGLDMLVSLQSIAGIFWSDPHIYNLVSYLVCAPFLIFWVYVTLRSRPTEARLWLGLAAISALSLLPVYHRQLDTKLLLLTVPACALLWAEGGLIGWLAVVVNAVGFFLNGDIPWAVLLTLIARLHLSTTGLTGLLLMVAQIFPAPLILLAMGAFYLWAYARRGDSIHPPPRL